MPHPPLPGPILYAREHTPERARIGVLAFTAENGAAPRIEAPAGEASEPVRLYARFGAAAWAAEIVLPAHPDAHYRLNGTAYPVLTELTGDLRVGFVSCNGREKGEDGWDPEERNVMWARLGAEHRASPLALLLQGGDQIYADGMKECHPEIKRWARLRPARRGEVEMTEEMEATAERYLFHRYLQMLAMPQIGALLSQVPSFMMWDDHDIVDGWGSHSHAVQQSEVGQALFDIARRMFRLFQLGRAPDGPTSAAGFTHSLRMPGFVVLAPDLRSTRTPTQVMSEQAWSALEAQIAALPPRDPLFLISTVPALGPRLSVAERLMNVIPGAQEYEDDLRDQWQSGFHRGEWRRFLRLIEREIEERGRPVVVLSGEIHLATRGEMCLRSGAVLHQLTASGIAHPAPGAAYPRLLGLLARFGEAPLEGRPIRLHPLPGRRWTYTRERNYLLLIRQQGRWCAVWETERHGTTDPLDLPAHTPLLTA